jgi:RNA polymerase subunit RPABC4/transcription elongation factor Spt4
MSGVATPKEECRYCSNGLNTAHQLCPVCGGKGFAQVKNAEETLLVKLKIDSELLKSEIQ